jgi:hypothetical protein
MTMDVLLIRDKITPDDYQVEAFDDDGRCEVAIFSGPRARARAGIFARAFYGSYRVVEALPEPGLCYQLRERQVGQH